MTTNITAAESPATARAATSFERLVSGLLFLLFLVGGCYLHFSRNVASGRLSPESMEIVQAARSTVNTRRLSTNVVRPLVLRHVAARPDGSVPDIEHAPLYPVLAGTAMKLADSNGPGQGDRVTAFLSLACFAVSLGACYLLALRLFGSGGAPLLACTLYAFGANALTLAVTVHPATMATALFTLLLLALHPLDVKGTARRAPALWAVGAGALFGLLFLTLYSALVLVVPLVWYLFVVTKRDYRAVLLFLGMAFLNPLTLAYLLRNAQVAGNPFFNARLLEFMMHTNWYPADSLYRATNLPGGVLEFLAQGGMAEIGRKLAVNLLGYYQQIPFAFGVFLLPLALVASLTRFTSPSVNRMRTLVWALLGVQVLALSLFVPYTEGLPILLMYLPFAAIIATVFFLNYLRARNLPPFYLRLATSAWVILACIPGVAQLVAPDRQMDAPPYSVYNALNTTTPQVPAMRAARDAVIASDVPREIAYHLDVPVVWLPMNSDEFLAVSERLGKPISGIVLTRALGTADTADFALTPWRATFSRLSAVLVTAIHLDRPTQISLLQKTRVYYPPEINEVLRSFQLQVPAVMEEDGSAASLIFWRGASPVAETVRTE